MGKCYIGEMLHWGNVTLGKCYFISLMGKMSVGKTLEVEMSFWENK